MEIRVAKEKDKNEFCRLWKICFGDSDLFCDWFFNNRFSAEHSVVLKKDGHIISCMQAYPYTIRIRDKDIPGAMLCGVSTHPDERKKGYMGKIFSYEVNHLKRMGYFVAPHTPAVLPSYFSYGHYPVANANYLECEVVPALETKVNLTLLEPERWKELHSLYTRFSEKYSGIISRTEADFLLKAADYAADGGKCAAYIKNNEIKGYAFYYQMEENFLCVEAVAEEGYYHMLMKGLFSLASGLRFSAKLPPDLYLGFPFVKCQKKQKGVMGLCDVAALLKKLDLDIPYTFQLYDPVVPENNGIFHFCGQISTETPVFEISAGHLLQVLVGYHSLEEIRKEILVFDEYKFNRINHLLPKKKCYIIDEY